MRKIAVLLLTILAVGSASAIGVEVEPVDRTADEDPAVFNLTITNTGEEAQSFEPNLDARNSWLFIGLEEVRLDPGESQTQQFEVHRDNFLQQTNYGFEIYVYDNGTRHAAESYYSVDFEDDIIVSNIGLDQTELTGNDNLEGSVEVRNTARTISEPVSLKLEAPEASEEYNLEQMSGGSSEELDFSLENPSSQPGENDLEVKLIEDQEVIWDTTVGFEIERIESIETETDTNSYIIFTTTEKTVTNTGNVEAEDTVSLELASHMEPITSVNPEPDITDEETISWNVELAEEEEITVRTTTHYWVPLLGILAIIAIALIIQQNLSRVKVTKTTREDNDKIKVHLEIENKAQKKFENLELVDHVPEIADTMIDFPMGDPVVRKHEDGTKLTYKLEEVEPGSQIVFEYTIDPRIEVEQEIHLPEAELREDGEVIARSGKAPVKFNLPDVGKEEE